MTRPADTPASLWESECTIVGTLTSPEEPPAETSNPCMMAANRLHPEQDVAGWMQSEGGWFLDDWSTELRLATT